MATSAIVHVRVDEDIKENATHVLNEMGLSVSDADRVLLTRIANDKVLPSGMFKPDSKAVAEPKSD